FYDEALAPLGLRRLDDGADHAGYGDTRPFFWIGADGRSGYAHIAFAAPARKAVDAFYHRAIAGGGRDNRPPGIRAHYHADYYGAFVLDPDGHNIEAVCHQGE